LVKVGACCEGGKKREGGAFSRRPKTTMFGGGGVRAETLGERIRVGGNWEETGESQIDDLGER